MQTTPEHTKNSITRVHKNSKFKPEMLVSVERLGGMGLNYGQIANVLDISPNTFTRYVKNKPQFDEAIKKGEAKANTKIISSLYKNATDKMNLGAQVFWLKNKCGWRDMSDNSVDNSKHVHYEIRLNDLRNQDRGDLVSGLRKLISEEHRRESAVQN